MIDPPRMSIDVLKLFGHLHHSVCSGHTLWIDNFDGKDPKNSTVAPAYNWRLQPIWEEWAPENRWASEFIWGNVSNDARQPHFIICGVLAMDPCDLTIGECRYATIYEPGWHEVGPVMIEAGQHIRGKIDRIIGWHLRVFP